MKNLIYYLSLIFLFSCSQIENKESSSSDISSFKRIDSVTVLNSEAESAKSKSLSQSNTTARKCYTIVYRDTLFYVPVTQRIKDSIEIACNDNPYGNGFGMYISGTNKKIIDPAKVDMLIEYSKQIGVNEHALYSINGTKVFGNPVTEKAMLDYINKAHANGISVIATYSGRTEIDAVVNFVKKYPKSFDGFIDEFEIYNQTDYTAALQKDTANFSYASAMCKKYGMKINKKYNGWPQKSIEYIVLNKYSTNYVFHYYRTSIDTTYGKQRIKDASKYTIGVTPLDPLLSFEPAFLKNAAIADKNILVKAKVSFDKFCAQFPNISMGKIYIFTDDYLLQCIPYVSSSSGLARGIKINYSGDDFDPNYTNPDHLKISQGK